MKKTFLTLLAFLVIGFVAFLLLSTNGFLGEDLGKKGEDLSKSIEGAVSQGVDSIGEFTGLKEEKKPVPQEDPKVSKFFKQLKTATPEVLADMVLNGFKPKKPNLAGEPPIVYMARYNDNPEVYELMLNIGASVEQTNRKGENALKVAIERGAPTEIIRILYANQEALDQKVRQERINEGPGSQIIGSYYPSIENQKNKGTVHKGTVYHSNYTRNKNLRGLE